MHPKRQLLGFLISSALLAAAHDQVTFVAPSLDPNVVRKLRGRFLHITDIHPDPHYKTGASLGSSCHRNKPKKDKERAGYWGTPYSDCDSPMILANYTLDFIEENWADKVDFVIWTGDNARHDNDNHLPRTPSEIYELNRGMVRRMESIFTSRGIPIVPSIGNNDIWPHNIMTKGPNSITNEFSSIWRSFIPFSSYQVFQRGGYFSVEVIPNEVAAVSLNTIYWYDSNKAVGGCEDGDEDDPGNLEFDWLEVQLEEYRDRGMQVWLTGHVPPTPGNYFHECYLRYGELALQFQDTIVGHLYGHMNVDHFFWIDNEDVHLNSTRYQRKAAKAMRSSNPNGRLDAASRADLHEELLKDFRELPKKSQMRFNNYAIINVSPSVIPTYLPSFRVFSYNVTGYPRPRDPDDLQDDEEDDWVIVDDFEGEDGKKKRKKGSKRRHGHRRHPRLDCSKPENEERRQCRERKPRHADPNSPSRTNTLWTPLGYSQFYLPDIDTANETHKPKWKLEYLTFPVSALYPPNGTDPETTDGDFHYPVPPHLLPRPLRHGNVTKSKYAAFEMDDLTIPSWIMLAKRLATKEKLWSKFKNYMYLGKDVDDDEDSSYDDYEE